MYYVTGVFCMVQRIYVQLTLDISNSQYLELFGNSNKFLGPLAIYYSSKTKNYSISGISSSRTFGYLELILKPLGRFAVVISNFMKENEIK